jgi:hypothetical protein
MHGTQKLFLMLHGLRRDQEQGAGQFDRIFHPKAGEKKGK